MSDMVQISRLDKAAPPVAPAPLPMPFTVELPTRYYSRAAVEETARAFDGIVSLDTRVGDGVLAVTFNSVDPEASDAREVREVIDEFLNHALYGSATASEEASR